MLNRREGSRWETTGTVGSINSRPLEQFVWCIKSVVRPWVWLFLMILNRFEECILHSNHSLKKKTATPMASRHFLCLCITRIVPGGRELMEPSVQWGSKVVSRFWTKTKWNARIPMKRRPYSSIEVAFHKDSLTSPIFAQNRDTIFDPHCIYIIISQLVPSCGYLTLITFDRVARIFAKTFLFYILCIFIWLDAAIKNIYLSIYLSI